MKNELPWLLILALMVLATGRLLIVYGLHRKALYSCHDSIYYR